MRVNISYSVELDSVLEEIQLLYLREHDKMRIAVQEAENTLAEEFSEKKLTIILQAIKDYKNAMASFDVKLTEINNILNGYNSILQETAAAEHQPVGKVEHQNE